MVNRLIFQQNDIIQTKHCFLAKNIFLRYPLLFAEFVWNCHLNKGDIFKFSAVCKSKLFTWHKLQLQCSATVLRIAKGLATPRLKLWGEKPQNIFCYHEAMVTSSTPSFLWISREIEYNAPSKCQASQSIVRWIYSPLRRIITNQIQSNGTKSTKSTNTLASRGNFLLLASLPQSSHKLNSTNRQWPDFHDLRAGFGWYVITSYVNLFLASKTKNTSSI